MNFVFGMAAVAIVSAWIPGDSVSIDQRVREWQPTARERRWEQIGWASSLLSAERIAKATNRPVFLFTHDGKLNVGRC